MSYSDHRYSKNDLFVKAMERTSLEIYMEDGRRQQKNSNNSLLQMQLTLLAALLPRENIGTYQLTSIPKSSQVLVPGPHCSLFTGASEDILPNAHRHGEEQNCPCHS